MSKRGKRKKPEYYGTGVVREGGVIWMGEMHLFNENLRPRKCQTESRVERIS